MYFWNKKLGNECNCEKKGSNWDSSSLVNQKWILLFERICGTVQSKNIHLSTKRTLWNTE